MLGIAQITITRVDDGQKGDTGLQGPQGVQGPKGTDGKQYYTWLKYADSPTSGMSDTPAGKAYIGLAYNKTSATESNTYSDYTWSLIKGDKGDQGVTGAKGTDGKQYYTWIKYATSAAGANISDDPSGKNYIGLAYNKTTNVESNTASDYTWSLIQGPKGDTGPAGSQGIQGIQGPQGTQGIQGVAGANGQSSYFHIKYAPVQAPTSAQMTETPNTFIGTYVDTTAADSTDPAKYAWSRFEGLQGATGNQGIPGANGSNGQTSYLHIKYSDVANPTQAAQINDVGGQYIGQYTDFTLADSTDPKKYTWTKIKGEPGNGVKSTTIDYALSTDKITAPTGGWQPSSPPWEPGKYRWTRTTITYTSAPTYTSYSCDNSWEAVNGIEVGGRNYFGFSKGINCGPSGTKFPAVFKPEIKGIEITCSTAITTGTILCRLQNLGIGLGENTFSADVSASNPIYIAMDLCDALIARMDITSTPKRFVGTAKVGSYVTAPYFGFWDIEATSVPAGTVITIANIKIEKGNRVTDWTPAPEDVEADIGDVNNKVDDIVPRVEDCESNIEQTARDIRLEVAASYVSGEEFESYKQTAMEVTDSKIEMQFTSLNDAISDVADDVVENQTLLETYIRFNENGIELGEVGSDFTAKLSNTELAFLQNGNKVAYISNNRLYITDAEITNSQRIGKFQWQPRDNGNLSLVYVG